MMDIIFAIGTVDLYEFINRCDHMFKNNHIFSIHSLIDHVSFEKVSNKLGAFTSNMVESLFNFYEYWINDLYNRHEDQKLLEFKYDKNTMLTHKKEIKKLFISQDMSTFFNQYNEVLSMIDDLKALNDDFIKYKKSKFQFKIVGNDFGDCSIVFYVPFKKEEINNNYKAFIEFKKFSDFNRNYFEKIKTLYQKISETIEYFSSVIEHQRLLLFNFCQKIFIVKFCDLFEYIKMNYNYNYIEDFTESMIKDMHNVFKLESS